MLLIVDDLLCVRESYATTFTREGISTLLFEPVDFDEWTQSIKPNDLLTIEGILIGEFNRSDAFLARLRSKGDVPVIAALDSWTLEKALWHYSKGADDVVRKPVHARELIARFAAICRHRTPARAQGETKLGGLEVFGDGRDPKINGMLLELPRRERRILEFLVNSRGRRISREQLFEAVYGFGSECNDDAVIESHISKLRKKLRQHLGFDPINCQRYLGYQFVADDRPQAAVA
jgi:two-component system, OmpR family, flagellar system response regulator FtcR